MRCRVKGPALVEFVNKGNGLVTYTVSMDGASIPIMFGPYEVAALFVADEIVFEEHPSIMFTGAMNMKGEPIEPECEEEGGG